MDYHEIDPTFEDDLKQQPISQSEWLPPWEAGSDPAEMLKWLKPATRAFDSASALIERDLFGDLPALRKQSQQVSEPEPTISIPRTMTTLVKFVERLGKAWNNEKHREAITGMLKPLLTALHFRSTPENDKARDKVVSSMLNLLGSEVHACAGDETI